MAVGFVQSRNAAPRLTFDVAAIRSATFPTPQTIQSGQFRTGTKISGNNLDFEFVTLADLIPYAYRVKPFQVVGPDWMRQLRWNILARLPDGAPRDQAPDMMQSLLTDRFKLAFHRERKELPVYVLETGKNSPKLHASDGEGELGIGQAAGGIGFQKITMSDFAGMFLSRIPMIDRPVLDRTGLQGRYDFTLQLSPGANADFAATKRAAVEEGFSLFVYALDQLGLRLEAEKALIEMLVIDHVERPSEN